MIIYGDSNGVLQSVGGKGDAEQQQGTQRCYPAADLPDKINALGFPFQVTFKALQKKPDLSERSISF